MKAGDKVRLSALRMLLTEVQSAGLRAPSGQGDLDEAGFQALVRRTIKQRKEAAEQYRNGNRPELAAKEEQEAEILAAYLPQQATEAQLRAAIAGIVADLAAQGVTGPAALGAVMKATLARFAGAADGGTVNRLARESLSGK